MQTYQQQVFVEAVQKVVINSVLENVWEINPFQLSDVSHIETSHLIYTANQMTGFYMKCNTDLRWVKKIKVEAMFTVCKFVDS